MSMGDMVDPRQNKSQIPMLGRSTHKIGPLSPRPRAHKLSSCRKRFCFFTQNPQNPCYTKLHFVFFFAVKSVKFDTDMLCIQLFAKTG